MEKFAKVRSVSEKATNRSSLPEVFLRKGVLKISSKFTGEYSCRIAISIKLLCNCIEMTLRYGCSPVNLLHIFRVPFPRNTSGWLHLGVFKNFANFIGKHLCCSLFLLKLLKVNFIIDNTHLISNYQNKNMLK